MEGVQVRLEPRRSPVLSAGGTTSASRAWRRNSASNSASAAARTATSQFSFTRLQGADPTVGVEMASTGEVGCLGDDFDEAFLKALISVGFKFPLKSVLLSTGPLVDKVAFVDSARLLQGLGVDLYATSGTAEFLSSYGVEAAVVHWPSEPGSPNAGDLIEQRKVDLVINIPKNYQQIELTNDYVIRRKAVDFGIPLLTNIHLANRLAEALSRKGLDDLKIKALQAY